MNSLEIKSLVVQLYGLNGRDRKYFYQNLPDKLSSRLKLELKNFEVIIKNLNLGSAPRNSISDIVMEYISSQRIHSQNAENRLPPYSPEIPLGLLAIQVEAISSLEANIDDLGIKLSSVNKTKIKEIIANRKISPSQGLVNSVRKLISTRYKIDGTI